MPPETPHTSIGLVDNPGRQSVGWYNQDMTDEPRPVATTDDTEFVLTIDDALGRYERAGHPRTPRTLQRFCASGHLECRKVAIATGDKYLITPQSVSRRIAQIAELAAQSTVAAGRDESHAVDIGTRYPVTSDLRVSPTLRLSYREGEDARWNEVAVMPSLRLNYSWLEDTGLEFEAGAKWSERYEGTAISEELEYFFLIGYHYDFDVDSRSFE